MLKLEPRAGMNEVLSLFVAWSLFLLGAVTPDKAIGWEANFVRGKQSATTPDYARKYGITGREYCQAGLDSWRTDSKWRVHDAFRSCKVVNGPAGLLLRQSALDVGGADLQGDYCAFGLDQRKDEDRREILLLWWKVTSEMFASRHTSTIDRPPLACLKIRILSSVLYSCLLAFHSSGSFRPRLSHPSTRKTAVTSNALVGMHLTSFAAMASPLPDPPRTMPKLGFPSWLGNVDSGNSHLQRSGNRPS